MASGRDRRTRIAQGNAALADALPHWQKVQIHLVETLGEKRWGTMLADLSEVVALAR